MEEFGRYLKEERLARGISLSAVQVTTRIRTTYLEAIEAGDFASLPGNTYARGFLKLYAKAIGLDPEEVVKRYDALQSQKMAEVQELLQTPSRERISERLARRRRKRRIQTLRLAGILILLVALIVFGRELLFAPESDVTPDGANGLEVGVLIDNPSPSAQQEAPGETESEGDDISVADSSVQGSDGEDAASVEPASEEPVDEVRNAGEDAAADQLAGQSDDVAVGEPGSGADDEAAVPAWVSGENEIQVTLTFEGLSWTAVWVDGERVVYQEVPEGTVMSWTAQESIRVRLGRGNEVRIELNGEDLGLAGNGVVDREFTIETVMALRGQED